MVHVCGNFPGGLRGEGSGWPASDRKFLEGPFLTRQQHSSGDARNNPREERGTPPQRSGRGGPKSRRVARLEVGWRIYMPMRENGEPEALFPHGAATLGRSPRNGLTTPLNLAHESRSAGDGC